MGFQVLSLGEMVSCLVQGLIGFPAQGLVGFPIQGLVAFVQTFHLKLA